MSIDAILACPLSCREDDIHVRCFPKSVILRSNRWQRTMKMSISDSQAVTKQSASPQNVSTCFLICFFRTLPILKAKAPPFQVHKGCTTVNVTGVRTKGPSLPRSGALRTWPSSGSFRSWAEEPATRHKVCLSSIPPSLRTSCWQCCTQVRCRPAVRKLHELFTAQSCNKFRPDMFYKCYHAES